MLTRCRLVTGLFVALTAVATHAQEPDILDAALARPLAVTVNGLPVRFGAPNLDAAELALHDLLPRPWTIGRIRPLFEAATQRLVESRQDGKTDRDPKASSEWEALVVHLGHVLAASRDPRGILALGRVLEGQSFPALCSLASGLVLAAESDTSYQSLPTSRGVIAFTNGCPHFLDSAQRWFRLNREEVERRAAAMSATYPPCTACELGALTIIEELRTRLRATAPRLRLNVQGGRDPRFVQFEAIITPIGGRAGFTRSMGRLQATSPDIPIGIPAILLGRNDLRMRALIISPGYETVAIDVVGTTQHPVIPVTLTPVPTRTLAGTVSFTNGAVPRPFVLGVDLRVTAANDSFGIFANSMSTLQGVAEAAVGADGRFTLVIPDITRDKLLAAAGNRFVLRAQGVPFVLEPAELGLDHGTDDPLNLSASPRPR